jgi:hypothetical protein
VGREHLVEYTKDIYGKELLFDKKLNFQVMMEWEKPYMEHIVDTLIPSGDVLEIGFGLGYSANRIQSFSIKSHTIIENDPKVLKYLYEWAPKQKNKVNIVVGCWQDVLSSLGKFDCIFFDDSPNEQYPDEKNVRGYLFYYQVLKNHANAGCRMSWYCDYPIYWIAHPETNFSINKYNINIPDNAEYILDFSKERQSLYVPVVTFKTGTTDKFIPIYLDQNFNIGFF